MERNVSRQTKSVLCLIVCTALLWGAWRWTATIEPAAPLPELQFFRARPPPAARQGKARPARAALPPEQMPAIRVGLLAEPARSVAIEVSESFVVRPVGSDKVLYRSERIGPTTVTASRSGLKIGKREVAASQVEIVPSESPAVWVEGHK